VLSRLTQAKPISLARSLDIPRAGRQLRFFRDCDSGTPNRKRTSLHCRVQQSARQPRGIAGLISPGICLYIIELENRAPIAVGNTAMQTERANADDCL